MLSLRSWQNNLITIIMSADKLTLYWLKPQKKSFRTNLTQFELKAHHTSTIESFESKPYLFDLTLLKKRVQDFIGINKISGASVSIGLSTPSIIEDFVSHPHATPTKQDFTLMQPSSLLWDYAYLYPHDNGSFVFYLCGIKQEQLLQYKLLAIAANLNLKAIMPARMALLQLYRHVQGPIFRHSQLAVTMQRSNNNIDQLCSTESIHRLLTINKNVVINFSEHAPYLRVALGLCLSNDLNESNR